MCWIRPRIFTCDMLFNSCIDHGQGDCWVDTKSMVLRLKNCVLCDNCCLSVLHKGSKHDSWQAVGNVFGPLTCSQCIKISCANYNTFVYWRSTYSYWILNRNTTWVREVKKLVYWNWTYRLVVLNWDPNITYNSRKSCFPTYQAEDFR